MQAGGQAIATRIPGAEHVIFIDVAHMVNLERPSDFNAVVLGFLERLL
ncbi:MAG: hypothetical protein M3069_09170 [Chloroflexota bacterium]|nr:hypothetical protein [Chloroflexota bacterium]